MKSFHLPFALILAAPLFEVASAPIARAEEKAPSIPPLVAAPVDSDVSIVIDAPVAPASSVAPRVSFAPSALPSLQKRLSLSRRGNDKSDAWPQRIQTKRAAWLPQNVAGKAGEANAAPSIFPSSWNWSSESERGTRFQTGDNARVAQSWRLGVDVPVSHPWGVATFSANYKESGGGVADSAERAAAGEKGGQDLRLRQDLKLGALSGSAQVALSQAGEHNALSTSAVPATQNGAAESAADLRWQVAPNLALTTSHRNRSERAKTPLELSNSANSIVGNPNDTEETPIFARQSSTQSDHAVGLEWKWSPSLSLQAKATSSSVETAAQTGAQTGALVATGDSVSEPARALTQRDNRDQEIGLNWKWSKSLSIAARAAQTRSGYAEGQNQAAARSLRDEQRATLSLQRRTKAGAWGVDVSRRWANQQMGGADDRRSDAVSLNAERHLMSWLSVRGSWRLSGEGNYLSQRFDDSAQREAEAQLKLPVLGNFALRYADRDNQSTSRAGDILGSGGAREYGIRYNTANNSGLGLALEYSVRGERAGAPSSNWRVGLTVK